MILRMLYHVLPTIAHDWMYALWDKVIVQHKCITCGRTWYDLGEPVFFGDTVSTGKLKDCKCLSVPKPLPCEHDSEMSVDEETALHDRPAWALFLPKDAVLPGDADEPQ